MPPSRRDLTDWTIVTIDPVDARDFDDAISLSRDEKGFWKLGVHIADVAHFVPLNSALDREARSRGTSVYLPGKVVPMLPELISNGLASLQQGRIRYTKSAFIEFDAALRTTHVEFANTATKVARRLTYEQAQAYFDDASQSAVEPADRLPEEVGRLLERMLALSRLLRERRRVRGMLELSMPEAELEYDAQGQVVGCHYAKNEESHQVIEEFMLTANEAVAKKLEDDGVAFLRRIHPSPDPLKLKLFGEFARSLGVPMDDHQSRFALQRVLRQTAGDPRQPAIHYALLRSLKEAVYGPDEEGHYALASDCYCHFTSPIRRYPDLTIHRLLDQLIRRGKAGSDADALASLGEHCSYTERRAAKAERELVKIKLLAYMSRCVGQTMKMVITGVEEFGFFTQGVNIPAEGMLHVRNLPDDYYIYDRSSLTLTGRRVGNVFRLGDPIDCIIQRVDQEARLIELRLAPNQTGPKQEAPPRNELRMVRKPRPKKR